MAIRNMEESTSLQITRRSLNTAGMRVTNQRSLIMEIIRQGGGHLDADEIYRRARKKRSRLSFSTVYRALQTFKKLGLVKELHLDEGHHHYEVNTSGEHHHLVCLSCGQVFEFHKRLSHYIKRNLAEAKDFDITETEVRVSGYCAECRQERLSAGQEGK
ncbi:transcriptional repressor [Dehalococcoidales bacterium]|nr:transcriptional repressor [Dehalococcoidales bacterium]MCL0091386.1 transcriptional repressor [Dehalococcoidales bacterium]